MEITRNDRSAKIALAGVVAAELRSVTFENSKREERITFSPSDPSDEVGSEGDKHINSDTEALHVKSENVWLPKSSAFNNLTSEVSIPHHFVTYAGKFTARWEYETDGELYSDIQEHTVVQPLFTAKDIKSFDPDFESLSDHDLIRLERVVRAIIERVTGQKFELTYGIHMARSYNGSSLMLPKRAVSLDDYSGSVAGVRSRVESDGWILRALNPQSTVTQFSANPIYDVYTHGGWKSDRYFLKGEWGYRSVPEQIQLAAMLLAQDYGCDQSVWRDRYIDMMKNVDWSITFHDKAFEGTGNVKVDQILQSYTVARWGIV